MQSAFFYHILSSAFSSTKTDEIGFSGVPQVGFALFVVTLGCVLYYWFAKRKRKRKQYEPVPGTSNEEETIAGYCDDEENFTGYCEDDAEEEEEEDDDNDNFLNDDDDDDDDDEEYDENFLNSYDNLARKSIWEKSERKAKRPKLPRGNYWRGRNFYNKRTSFSKRRNSNMRFFDDDDYEDWDVGKRRNSYSKRKKNQDWPSLRIYHYSVVILIVAVLVALIMFDIIGNLCAVCTGFGGIVLVLAHACFFC